MNPRIDALLDGGLHMEAFIRLERMAMEGERTEEAWLRRLPAEMLAASPLLMREMGDSRLRAGDLREAKLWLTRAIAEFGATDDPDGLLAVLCSLAPVLLRLGEVEEASTLFEFLEKEAESLPAERMAGAFPLALAFGCAWKGEPERAQARYAEAIDLFERKQMYEEATAALAELLQQCEGRLSERQWEELAWRLRHWASRAPGVALAAEWMPGLRLLQSGQWEEAYACLRPMADASWEREPYRHRVYVHLALFRAALRIDPLLAEGLLPVLAELKQAYDADLEMRRDMLLTVSEGCSLLGRTEEARDALKEAGYIERYLKLKPDGKSDAAIPAVPTDRSPQPREDQNDYERRGWRIVCFGGLSFERGEHEVRHIRWKRKKAQELCVFLLLQPKYAYPKEQLVEQLELGEDRDKANKLLYVVIHQLKQTLLEELAVRDGAGIREGMVALREDAFDHVDVERYLTLIRVADQLWLKDRALSYEMYQEAFGLYDDLLPELPYFSWLERMREFLLDKQAAILRKLRLLAEEQGDGELEETYCREWIRLQPEREEAYAHLIRLLLALKRNGEISALYDRLSRMCREELGTEPSEELRALVRGNGIVS